mmetsp:Transcript_20669/g.42597  ORF Transcript_20669/g.42597 Transcript_20669/m.42597 type:complete len:391 (-) Transcript_20669:39-1211(-)
MKPCHKVQVLSSGAHTSSRSRSVDMQPSSNTKHPCWSYHASSQLASLFAESRSKKGAGKQQRRPKRNITSPMLETLQLQPSEETQTEQFTKNNTIPSSNTDEKNENDRVNNTPTESEMNVENFRFDFALACGNGSGKTQSDEVSSKKKSKKKKNKKKSSAKNKQAATNGSLTNQIDGTHHNQNTPSIFRGEDKISGSYTKALGNGNDTSTPNCNVDSAALHCLKVNYTQTSTCAGSHDYEATSNVHTTDNRDINTYNSTFSNQQKSIVGILPSSSFQTSIDCSRAKTSSPQSMLTDEMTKFHFDPIVSNRGAMVNRNSMNLHRQNRDYHLQRNSVGLSNSGGHLNTNHSTRRDGQGASDNESNPFTFGFSIFGQGILPPTPTNSSVKKEE